VSKKSDFSDSVKQPDAFVTSTHVVLKFVEDHSKSFAALVLIGAIVGLGYVGMSVWRLNSENKAAEKLYQHEAKLKKAEEQIREERAKKMQALAGLSAKKTEEEVRPVDFPKDFAPLVASLKAELKNVGSTRAAMVSALNLSSFLVQQKQYQEALEVLQTTDVKPAKSDLLGGFWRMHYGLVLIENNKADEALSFYQDVLNSQELKPFHSEAMLKTGIAQELKGDKDKARDTYEKIGREYPNTEASAAAAQYLRLLELKARG
jgi:TolA-binding protein